MGDEQDEEPTAAERARLNLIVTVILDFAGHLLVGRRLVAACSPGGLHPRCATRTNSVQLCIYCALTRARILYGKLDPHTTDAELAEVMALAAADAEQQHLDSAGTMAASYATALLHNLAHARMLATTAPAPTPAPRKEAPHA